MDKIKLGSCGLEVSKLGLGCMGMTQSYPPFKSDNDMIKLIHNAIDLGITFFDTSEAYGPYKNEKLIGEALKSYDNIKDNYNSKFNSDYNGDIIIATKFGWDIRNGSVVGLDSSPEAIINAVDGSLERLNKDSIDLLYQHRLDPKVPIEIVAETVANLIDEGKVKYFGLSEVGSETISKANEICPVTAVQSEYSMIYRNVELNILPTLEKLGIGFVPFSPLGKGFLTGKIRKSTKFENNDFRNEISRFDKENLENNLKLVDLIEEIAEEKNKTPAQIALAWVMNQKPWIVPIPGTKSLDRLKENIGSIEINFTQKEMDNLNNLISKINILGERYPESQEALTEK